MSRLLQHLVIVVVLLAVVAVVLLMTNLGAGKDGCALVLAGSTIGCFLRTYKELAAGLLGAAGAIFAAWIAWLAVQRQIQKEEMLATAHSRETFDAIKTVLTDEILPALHTIWKALDLARPTSEDNPKPQVPDQQGLRATIYLMLRELPPPEYVRSLERLSRDIGPLQRLNLSPVLETIRWFYSEAKLNPEDRLRGNHSPSANQTYLAIQSHFLMLRTILSRLVTALTAFDPSMARIFDNRAKTDGEVFSLAEHLDHILESFLKGGTYS